MRSFHPLPTQPVRDSFARWSTLLMYRFGLVLLLAAGGALFTVPTAAQSVAPVGLDSLSLVEATAQEFDAAQTAHLRRVAVWGGVNLLGGLALMLSTRQSQRSARWHFGAMSAGWGAVNVGIAAAGTITASPTPADPAAVLAAERQFHDILLFNLGLNVAYSAVGGTMLRAGYRGVGNAGRWRGFGTALLLQGGGLLVLDGIAFFASRSRLNNLLDAGIALSAHPTGLTLTVSL